MNAELGDRSWFPQLESWAYLSHAAISPPSTQVLAAAQQAMQQYAQVGIGAWLDFREQREGLRAKLGRLVGARAEDVALVSNTTAGVVAVAQCTAWRRGDRVLCIEGEFPTNVTPWQRAAQQWDLRLEFLPLRSFEEEAAEGLHELERRLREGVRLVAVSLVQFQSGLRMPVEQMGRLCHEHGARLFVDGIQGVGAQDCSRLMDSADYVAVGSHKWLMGLEGAGFLALRPECAADWVPRLAGWLSHEDAATFLFEGEGHLRYDRAIRRTPDHLESGSMNVVGFAALEAAVDPLLELGAPAIHGHIQTYLDELERGLVERGFRSLRATRPEARSGILALIPGDGRTSAEWAAALSERGVVCTMPDGRLRFAPHWPNAVAEVARVLEVVDDILRGEAVREG